MIKKVCEVCGSDRVCKDADAIWDEASQTWVLDPTKNPEQNSGYCRKCQTEREIEDVVV
jgi:hypothetical protein